MGVPPVVTTRFRFTLPSVLLPPPHLVLGSRAGRPHRDGPKLSTSRSRSLFRSPSHLPRSPTRPPTLTLSHPPSVGDLPFLLLPTLAGPTGPGGDGALSSPLNP